MRPSMISALCALLLLAATHTASAAPFLAAKLPLEVVSITPLGNARNDEQAPVALSQDTALTVVFTRPVIALGSDFDGVDTGVAGGVPLPVDKVPLLLTTSDGVAVAVPYRLRYATTFIARIDVDTNGAGWPTDLDLHVSVNRALTTFDGVPVTMAQRGNTVVYATPSLSMSVNDVFSLQALTLTDGLWDANMPGADTTNENSRFMPEVPPDGELTVHFSHDVDMSLLFNNNSGGSGENRVAAPTSAFSLRTTRRGAAAGGIAELPSFTITPCDDDTSMSSSLESGFTKCVKVLPRGLAVDGEYELVLPAGARYHPWCGALRTEQTIAFRGLHKFTINVANYDAGEYRSKASYRRYHFWLRHGLADGTSVADVAAALTVTHLKTREVMPYTATFANKGTLRIDCAFEPSSEYTFTFAADNNGRLLTDGYGLTLQQTFSVQTADAVSFLTEGQGFAVFETPAAGDDALWPGGAVEFDSTWTFMCRANAKSMTNTQRFAALDTASKRASLLYRTRHNSRMTLLPSDQYYDTITPSSSDVITYSSKSSPAGTSALVYRETQHRYTSTGSTYFNTPQLVSYTDLSVASIVDYAPFGDVGANRRVVWVMRYSTGAGVAGAAVTLYASKRSSQQSVAVATGVTDADGVVVLTEEEKDSSSQWGTTYDLYVESTGQNMLGNNVFESALLPRVPSSPSSSTSSSSMSRGTVITDRGLYKPGDSIHVKAYVRELSTIAAEWLVPMRAVTICLSNISRQDGSQYDVDVVGAVVAVDGVHGSADVTLTLPSDVQYGTGSVQLLIEDERGNDRHVGSATFVIADPRRPTVTLDVSTDANVYLLATAAVDGTTEPGLPIKVAVATGAGVAIGGAEIALKWSLTRAPDTSYNYLPWYRRPSRSTAGVAETGIARVISGDDGNVAYTVRMSTLLRSNAQPLKKGDIVTITAVWVGPTGELVQSAVTKTAAYSAYSLSLTSSNARPLPGFQFAAYVAVTDAAGGDVVGKAVSLSLRAATEQGASSTSTSAAIPVFAGGVEADAIAVSECTASSDGGKTRQCALRLPSVGKFELVAIVIDERGVVVSALIPLGKSASEWAEKPLSQIDDVAMRLDKQTYTVGDTATVSFTTPYPRGRLLLRWGNALNVQQRIVSVNTVGDHSVDVAVGRECQGGCTLAAVLVSPRTYASQGGFSLPIAVPISKVFDTNAPNVVYSTLAIPVADDKRALDVAISLPELTGSVAEPGATVNVKVTVSQADGDAIRLAAGGEVAIFAVDRAFLDLTPSPLVATAKQFEIEMATTFNVQSTHEFLAPRNAVSENVDVITRRANADPWLSPTWALRANNNGGGVPSPLAATSDDAASVPDFCAYAWQCRSRNNAEVDETDEAYFDRHITSISRFPQQRTNFVEKSRGGGDITFAAGGMPEMAMDDMMAPTMASPPSMDSADGGASRSGDVSAESSSSSSVAVMPVSPDVPVRSQFETTPLFIGKVTLDAEGSVIVPLTLPGNIATFLLRAYATAFDSSFGSAETEVVARRTVSMEAMLPRVARVGDDFTAGVTVAASAADFDDTLSVTVEFIDGTAQSLSPARVLSIDTTTVSTRVTGTAPVKVKFPIKAVALGTQKLRFTARDSNNVVVDAVEAELECLGVQGGVIVATSMAIDRRAAADTAEAFVWPERIAFPAAVKGSGSVTVSAGVGRYPAVLALGRLLLRDQSQSNERVTAPLTVARAFMKAPFAPYAPSTSSTTTTTPATTTSTPALGEENNGYAAVSQRWLSYVALLRALTDARLGLFYSSYSLNRYYSRADASLQTFALYAAKRVAAAEATAAAAGGSGGGDGGVIPTDLTATWTSALETELLQRARDARENDYVFSDWTLLADTYAAKGVCWTTRSDTHASDVTIAALLAAVDDGKVSLDARLRLVVAYTRDATTPCGVTRGVQLMPAFVAATVREVVSSLRTQGRTAYVSALNVSGAARPLRTQARALLALVHAAGQVDVADTPLVEKLANHVAQGSSNSPGFGYAVASESMAAAAEALAAYDQLRGNTQPDISLKVTSGAVSTGVLITESRFTSPRDEPTVATKSWEALISTTTTTTTATPLPLLFHGAGKGEASVAVELSFTPLKLIEQPVYRGIYVEKAMRVVNEASGRAEGGPRAVFEAGSIVEVTIQVTTADDLKDVEIVDWLPAALEAMDPLVTVDPFVASAQSPSSSSSSSSSSSGSSFSFPVPEIMVDDARFAPPSMPSFDGGSGKSSGSSFGGSGFDNNGYGISPPRCYSCWGWWNPFGARQTMKDQVRWASTRLSKGTHSVSYRAVVVTTGTFALPPAHAFVAAQPELMGLSAAAAAGVFIVDAAAFAAANSPTTLDAQRRYAELQGGTFTAPLTSPKECASACLSTQYCDVAAGACVDAVAESLYAGVTEPVVPVVDDPYEKLPDIVNNDDDDDNDDDNDGGESAAFKASASLASTVMLGMLVVVTAVFC